MTKILTKLAHGIKATDILIPATGRLPDGTLPHLFVERVSESSVWLRQPKSEGGTGETFRRKAYMTGEVYHNGIKFVPMQF